MSLRFRDTKDDAPIITRDLVRQVFASRPTSCVVLVDIEKSNLFNGQVPMKTCLNQGSTPAARGQNGRNSLVAATFEKANTYVFAAPIIRDRELVGSNPLARPITHIPSTKYGRER